MYNIYSNMDKLYKKFNLDKFTSGSTVKLRKLLIKELITSVKGDKELVNTAKNIKYFDFNDFDKIKSDLVNEYNRRRENAVKIIQKHWKRTNKNSNMLEFEAEKINSAYKNYSSTWFIRKKLTEDEKRKSSKKSTMYDIIVNESSKLKLDVPNILYGMNKTRENLYEEYLNIHKNIRINERLRCVFFKHENEGRKGFFMTADLPEDKDNIQCNATIHNKNKIEDVINKNNEIMLDSIETFINNGSDYILYSIKGMYCNIDKYQPLKASSYIDLPSFIKNKCCCINVKNKDNYCFVYSIFSCLRYNNIKKNHERPSSYDKNEVNTMISTIEKLGITFPIQIINRNITKIEKALNISINIYSFDMAENECNRYPVYISKRNDDKPINLLYFSNNKNNYHFVWIRNFNGFLFDITKDGHTKYFCTKCLLHFFSEDKLKQHKNDFPNCNEHNQPARLILPKKDDAYIEFKNYNKKFKAPFVIYADFESILTKNKQDNNIVHNHVSCSFMFYVVSSFEEYQFTPQFFRGENATNLFLKALLQTKNEIMEILQHNKPMIMTDNDTQRHKRALLCHICEKPLKGDSVRDHCHITGKYLGPAHYDCNINRNYKNYKIPVFFHNGRGYDSHFIINEISNFEEITNINMIPKTEEKYVCYDFNNLKFLDSLSFMNPSDSLEKLVQSLRNKEQFDTSKFIHTKKYFKTLYPNMTEEDFKLIISKGIYPYEYMNSFKKFEYKSLPDIKHFYSSLNLETISEKQYEHALKVWKTFNIKTLGEYHDFYLKTDVLLLADVFENFRKVDLDTYSLDPAHYITGCSYSFDASIKQYGKRIQLFNDEQSDMYLFIEGAIRGGMSFIAHRHSKANNKYMNNYNKDKPSKYIVYLDANNLYGSSMIQKLAVGNYKWEDANLWNESRIKNINEDGETGYIFEVDLEYPTELHDLHNHYPLCPERKLVKTEMLSDYQFALKKKLKISDDHVEKLITDLHDKYNYRVYYKNLQLYLQLGLRLKKIHKVLSFTHEAILKDYINSNSFLRQQAKANKDEFGANIYKIKNNGVFGKQMENVRNRCDIKLVKDNTKRYNKLISHPAYKYKRTIFNENLVAVHMNKKEVKLDKPIINGFIILELSKHLMYDFYYNVLKKRYKDKIKLLFTDTDSLLIEVETEDVYKDMQEQKEYYDCSEYPKDHFLYNTDNQAVVGKFKDEEKGEIITEFVGLRSKLYSLKVQGKKEEKKVAKGVKQCIIKKVLKFKDYKNTLDYENQTENKMHFIKSIKHNVSTIEVNKICLSSFDNKRYLLDDGITSLAFGHYKTKQ